MKAFAFASLVVMASCGARTGLDTGRIVVTNVACTSDAQCEDGVACTFDQCDEVLGVCTHGLRDSLCDDGVFCDGTEQCDLTRGCVTTPRSCDDAIACTNDACDETKRACVHAPDDSKCPISQACNPESGCEQRAFVHDFQTLYDVRLPSGVMTPIGNTKLELTDIALSPDDVLWGLSFDGISQVDQKTGTVTVTQSLATQSINGADFAPDGTLFVSGGDALFTVELSTGALTQVATFPPPRTSSGDLAFVGARLLATAANEINDELVEFDLQAGTVTILGSVGFRCVWGLAAYGTSLYGFTCEGKIISIDTTTGQGTLVASPEGAQFWGASAR